MKLVVTNAEMLRDRPVEHLENECGVTVGAYYGAPRVRIYLELEAIGEDDSPDFWAQLQPGTVISDFGIQVAAPTPSLPSKNGTVTRKLCLE